MTRASRLLVSAAAAVVSVLISALLASAVAAGALGLGFGQAAEPSVEVHRVAGAEFEPRPDAPVFVLIVGTDYRPGVEGHRADAVHLVGVDPASGQATVLNIPRDTYVAIPGHGSNKINAANTFGGAPLMVEAVAGLTGIRAHFVVTTDFAGFVNMVEELGGLPVEVTQRMAEPKSGAYFDPGVVHMNGHQALAYARNRYLEGGDFTRSAHQAQLIISGLAELRSRGTSAADTARYLGVLLRHARFHDAGVSDLYRFGRLALSIDPAAVRNLTMPGAIASAGGRSVVLPAAPAAEIFADLADDGVVQRF